MKKLLSPLVLFILLPLLLTTCGPKEEYYYLDEEIKSYISFPVGSYWIYQEKSFGLKDSVYVIHHSGRVGNDSPGSYRNFEILYQHIVSTYLRDTIIGLGQSRRLPYEPCFYEEGIKAPLLLTNVYFFSNRSVGDSLYVGGGFVTHQEAYHETLQVGNQTYGQVKVFTLRAPSVPDWEVPAVPGSREVRRIYYAQGVGVIKKELYNGQVWELLRYHIEPK